jgi:hypothetical protein
MRSTAAPLAFVLMILALGTTIILQADAEPTAVIDQENITYDRSEPKYSDSLTITAPVVTVDADIVSVKLEWKLCTESACNIPTKSDMADNGDGTYSATIGGPFEEKDGGGDPYIDIGFTIEVTYTAVGGGDEEVEESDEITVYFNTTIPSGDDDTDDDDDTSEDDDDKKTPFGIEILFAGILIAVGVFALKRRK